MWTLEGTTMHPRCRLIECRVQDKNYLQNMTAETLRQAFLLKDNQFLGFPCCSLENLSNHVPITNVGLILTKLR